MPHLKEAILIFKGGKYTQSHESDRKLMEQYGGIDNFIEVIDKNMRTDPEFVRFRKHLRGLRCAQMVVGGLMTAYILAFIVSLIGGDIGGGKKDPYEYLFLGFCIIILLFFITVAWMIFVEAKSLRPMRGKILKSVRDSIVDSITEYNFIINMDRSLTLRVRPMNMNQLEDEENDIENMDYYDYINYNNPEDDDYYGKQNPYELDPHEKNIMADVVEKREREIERESKKGRKMKFLAEKKPETK